MSDVARREELATTEGDASEGACDDRPCHCTTCGDVAEPMTVLRVDAGRDLALCADAGGTHVTVEIALVGPVAPGDALLVHAGVAIAPAVAR